MTHSNNARLSMANDMTRWEVDGLRKRLVSQATWLRNAAVDLEKLVASLQDAECASAVETAFNAAHTYDKVKCNLNVTDLMTHVRNLMGVGAEVNRLKEAQRLKDLSAKE